MEISQQLTVTMEAKDSIQLFFSNEINRLTDTSNETYNFPQAQQVLEDIKEIYPDSSFLTEQNELVEERKKNYPG